MATDNVEHCLKLLKLTPAKDLERNVFFLSQFVDADELMGRVDVPLGVATDSKVDKPFLTCDYNRDEDSHRSPHSNEYFPPLTEEDEPTFPSPALRKLEVLANEMFSYYVRLYYGRAATGSVYCFDQDDAGAFGACWVVKKELEDDDTLAGCTWDCKHIFEVRPQSEGIFSYTVQTNVLVTVNVTGSTSGKLSMKAHSQQSHRSTGKASTDAHHVRHMGTLLEQAEGDARSKLQTYLSKMKMVVNRVRDARGRADGDKGKNIREDLARFMKKDLESRK